MSVLFCQIWLVIHRRRTKRKKEIETRRVLAQPSCHAEVLPADGVPWCLGLSNQSSLCYRVTINAMLGFSAHVMQWFSPAARDILSSPPSPSISFPLNPTRNFFLRCRNSVTFSSSPFLSLSLSIPLPLFSCFQRDEEKNPMCFVFVVERRLLILLLLLLLIRGTTEASHVVQIFHSVFHSQRKWFSVQIAPKNIESLGDIISLAI